MSLSSLPTKEFDKSIKKMKGQHHDDDCYLISIFNAIKELERRGVISSSISQQRLKEICLYREGLGCVDDIVPEVVNNELARFGYFWVESTGTIDKLREITSEKGNSPVLVNVGKGWPTVHGVRVREDRYAFDHVWAILGVNTEIIYFMDPFYSIYNRLRTGKTDEDFKRYMQISSFIQLWDSAENPRWISWAQPKDPKQKSIKEY